MDLFAGGGVALSETEKETFRVYMRRLPFCAFISPFQTFQVDPICLRKDSYEKEIEVYYDILAKVSLSYRDNPKLFKRLMFDS